MTSSTVQTLEAAAVPAVVAVLKAAQTAFSTIFTGDPVTSPARAVAALQVFLGQADLALLNGGSSEFAAVGAVANTAFGNLIAKVQALTPTAPAASVAGK